MKIICLRRTKNMKLNGNSIVNLPPISYFIYKVKFNLDERRVYDEIEMNIREKLKKYKESNDKLCNNLRKDSKIATSL